MIFKYFFARLKRNIWAALAGSAALFIVALSLTVAAALPSILNGAVAEYGVQLCGNADLILTNSNDNNDRFFSLATLRGDATLADNAEYINGYFKTYAQVSPANNKDGGEYCTLFAADFARQNEYNPIISESLPSVLYDNEIIIGADYAAKAGLSRGGAVNIMFGGKTVEFIVKCIAENEGLFYSGNAVFIPSRALSRVISGLPSTIVTHCFIKAKDAAALTAIKDKLAADYAQLDAASAADDTSAVSGISGAITAPAITITAIVSAFCVISLAVLLRLAFARDRANFALLSSLGMPKVKIAAVTALTGLLMCAVSLVCAFFAVRAVQNLGREMLFLTRNFKIGAVPYIIGLGGSFIAGMACAFFASAVSGGRSSCRRRKASFHRPAGTSCQHSVPRDTSKSRNALSRGRRVVTPDLTGKQRFVNSPVPVTPFIIFALSLVCALIGLLTVRNSPYLGLAFCVLAIAGLILFLPKVIAPLFSAIHRVGKNIYTLRLKTLAKSPDWQRFCSFITAGALVILTVLSVSVNQHNLNEKQYPFDIVVTEIRSVSESFFAKAAAADGAAGAVRCELNMNAQLKYKNLDLEGSLFGLDADGFALFGADFSLTGKYGGQGVVIGRFLASYRALKVGDGFTYRRGGADMPFTVAGIADSQYLNGNFILANLARFATPARPWSEILIIADGAVDAVISSIDSAIGGGVSVISVGALNAFVTGFYSDFITLLDILCVAFAALTAITFLFMVLMRRSGKSGEAAFLKPLGLSDRADVLHNLSAVFFALLPVMLFLSFPMLLFIQSGLAVNYISGIRVRMLFLPSVVFSASAVILGFIALVETAVCGIYQKRGGVEK